MIFKKSLTIVLIFLNVSAIHTQELTKLNHDLRHYLASVSSESLVPLLVEGDPNLVPSLVSELNGKVRLNMAPLFSIEIPAKNVSTFSQNEVVQLIEFSLASGKALNDTMLIQTRADKVHMISPPLRDQYSGEGVILGVIDSGVELNHPDFKDSKGNTRILYVWDQGVAYNPNRKPGNYNYGVEWDSASINNGQSTHDDKASEFGHGSNVTGAAAANGMANGNFVGVAPKANIISVATDFNKPNWLQTVVEAVDYIFKKADTLNMPCVINASIGTYIGSHDGKDIAARMIDQLIKQKQGRSFVCAAGNAATFPFHLRQDPQNDTVFTWFRFHPQLFSGLGGVYFEVWSDTSDFNHMQFAFGADKVNSGSYEFRGRTTFSGVKNRVNQLHTDSIISKSGNRLAYVNTYVEESQGRYKMEVAIISPDSSNYRFRLESTGNGHLDVWSSFTLLRHSEIITDNLPSLSQWPLIAKYQRPDSLQTMVSSFTCLPSAITVGNYVNRSSYIDVNGTPRNVNVTPGQISVNSSLGPNREGYLKPEISSAGDYMFAAGRLATIASAIQSDPAKVSQDSLHYRNGGTSMASPTVAGMVALLLEKCPNLNYQEIKSKLINSARTDQFTSNLPNPKWGWGKADAFKLLSDQEFAPSLNNQTNSICQGDSIVLNLSSPYQNYLWSNGDTSISTTIKTDGSYFAKVINAQGCYSQSDTVTITAFPAAVKPLITRNQDSLKTGLSGQFQWFFNQVAVTGAVNNYIVATQNGSYYCQYTDQNGCVANSDTVSVIISSIKENTENRLFTISPNPTEDYLSLSKTGTNQIHFVSLFDMQGKETFRKDIHSREQRTKLNLSLLPKGLFLLKIYHDRGVQVEKLVIK